MTLALQLYQTPWLEEHWSKDDIFFIHRTEGTLYDHAFVSRQFSRVKPAVSEPDPSGGPPRSVRNRTLFALGVTLIELWCEKPLDELSPDSFSGANDWYRVYQLAEDLYEDAGESYSDAVRRCIWCDFDRRATDLEDVGFQKAV